MDSVVSYHIVDNVDIMDIVDIVDIVAFTRVLIANSLTVNLIKMCCFIVRIIAGTWKQYVTLALLDNLY